MPRRTSSSPPRTAAFGMKKPQALLAQPRSLLFWGKDSWQESTEALLLHDPRRILVTDQPAEVPRLLEEAQTELNRGYYLAGYLSYEAGAAFGLPTHPPRGMLPLIWLASYPPEHVQTLPQSELYPRRQLPALSDLEMRLNVGSKEYMAAIAEIKRLIATGDTYQVNYTCHARFHLDTDPLDYFLTLVRSHPVPYAAYLNLGEAQVLSMSPELFLQRRGTGLETRPMKGTRRRGRTFVEDEELARDLVTAEKDRAENVMILDMMRNDLGKIARVGSVAVPAMFTAEKYRSLWQMTSTAVGRIPPELTLREILAATFPGASITGAPKRRTMEIIRDLEPEPRGIYTGALGLFQPSGDFTCNLPIRTLVHRESFFDLGIGAGIVWDSDPQSEYEETLLKSHFAFAILPDLRLWETLLLTESGKYAYAAEHLTRLACSADYWDFPGDREQIERALDEFAAQAGGPLVIRLELDQDGKLHFSSRLVPAAPERPVRVLLSPRRVDSGDRFLFHKTNQRELYDQERTRAQEEGYFEVLFCNEQGHLTEGAITNLFVQVGSEWITPPLADGLLPGIWRDSFKREVAATERSLTIADLASAEEVVIGNSVRGAIPVGEIWRAEGVCYRHS